MKLKLLDRYIIGKFLGTYIFAIVLILAITIMLDINEKLDSFLKAPLKETVFDYFLNFLPYFANQFSPLFTFIAVIFFTSKLADNSEIIAMLSAGMSYKRLLVPYMLSAAVIASATFVLSAVHYTPRQCQANSLPEHVCQEQSRQLWLKHTAHGVAGCGSLHEPL